uniref:Uncharacterized protein n=1 Tax=Glossina austeni TaxID=7395 RepID=A0A1A9UNY7_GLOAU
MLHILLLKAISPIVNRSHVRVAQLSVNMLDLASRVVNNEFTSTIISVILIKYDQTDSQSSLIEIASIEEKKIQKKSALCKLFQSSRIAEAANIPMFATQKEQISTNADKIDITIPGVSREVKHATVTDLATLAARKRQSEME